jgi:hypothetical protein
LLSISNPLKLLQKVLLKNTNIKMMELCRFIFCFFYAHMGLAIK